MSNQKGEPIENFLQPIKCHARGWDHWTYGERVKFGFKLIFGARVHYSYCNVFQACFLPGPPGKVAEDSELVFIGLERLPGHAQLVIGNPKTVDIEEIDPIYHLIPEPETRGENGKRT